LAPKIIVEPILFDDANLMDYKFFCYRGEPRLIQVDLDRATAHKRALFDTHWNALGYSIVYPTPSHPVPRPTNLTEMLDAAARLSADFDLIRVDLYTDGERFHVGELTNCPGSAIKQFVPPEAEEPASRLLFDPPVRAAA
jgi:hypothetical protein